MSQGFCDSYIVQALGNAVSGIRADSPCKIVYLEPHLRQPIFVDLAIRMKFSEQGFEISESLGSYCTPSHCICCSSDQDDWMGCHFFSPVPLGSMGRLHPLLVAVVAVWVHIWWGSYYALIYSNAEVLVLYFTWRSSGVQAP
jgi:hypothetical protein